MDALPESLKWHSLKSTSLGDSEKKVVVCGKGTINGNLEQMMMGDGGIRFWPLKKMVGGGRRHSDVVR